MVELMKQLQELVTAFLQKTAELDKKTAACDANTRLQLEVTEVQATKDTDLKARETKVEGVESKIVLKQEAENMLKDLEQQKEKFVAEKEAYATFVAKETQAINEQKIDIKSQLEDIAKKEKATRSEQSTGLKSALESLIARTPKLTKESKGEVLKGLLDSLGKK